MPSAIADGEVDLAREMDAVVDQVGAHLALATWTPLRLQGRPQLEKGRHPIDRLASKIGTVGLADRLEPVAQAGVGVGHAGDGLVDELLGYRLAADMHRQLDRSVGHAAPRLRHRPPVEPRVLLGQEADLAS